MAEFPKDSSLAVDKTQWDWTMPGWVIRAYVEKKLAQMTVETGDPFVSVYKWIVWQRLAEVLGPNSRFRMSNGLEWIQEVWGLMKSGWILTLSLNSDAQHSQHCVAWMRFCNETGRELGTPPMCWAMGDDILMKADLTDEEVEQFKFWLESTGCLVKKIERNREFCGFTFHSNDRVEPLYPDKHQFILRSLEGKVEQETLLSYELLYAMSSQIWLDSVSHRKNFALGPMARLWAKGLVQLEILDCVPEWAKF